MGFILMLVKVLLLIVYGTALKCRDHRLSEDDSNDQNRSESCQDQDHSTIVSFHPQYYNFNDCPIGLPQLGIVRVTNRLNDENLKLISISGSSVHFQSSFFADVIIPPMGNTTFDVVFLSREEGQIDSVLHIHTSKGLFNYFVHGFGVENPYRLKPLVGARIPVNASYEPVITMHNPHERRIQVVEMVSSATDFQLQLNDDVDPHSEEGSLWAIEPFQTKSLMKGSFFGKKDGNHSGYIKIRLNDTSLSDYLLLPVDVEVCSTPGIYIPQDYLDFGLMIGSDKPRTLSLTLINAQPKTIVIKSVNIRGSGDPAVKIEFRPLTVEPGSSTSTVIALVTFDPSRSNISELDQGFIDVQSECGQSTSVPYKANVLVGNLEFNASSLGFYVKSSMEPARNFSVRNGFSKPIAFHNVKSTNPKVVQVKMNVSHILKSGEQKEIFSMHVTKKASLCDMSDTVEIILQSNISVFRFPLSCYDGNLQLLGSENEHLEMGSLEANRIHIEYLSIENTNPVEIRLKSWGTNLTSIYVNLVGMDYGRKEDIALIQDFDSLKKSLFLQPNHMAVFSIEVRRPHLYGHYYGECFISTDHNQTILVPFHFVVRNGKVQIEDLIFTKAFPGKVSVEKVIASSTFDNPVIIKRVRIPSNLPMWYSSSQKNPELSKAKSTVLGNIHLDPKGFCEQCFTGFSLISNLGKQWLNGLGLKWEGVSKDAQIFSSLQDRFSAVKEKSVSNMSLWIETNEHGSYKVKCKMEYTWPRLVNSKVLSFPLTSINNVTTLSIPVHNPSSSMLMVHVALSRDYPAGSIHFPFQFNASNNSSHLFNLVGVHPIHSSQSNGSVILKYKTSHDEQDVSSCSSSPRIFNDDAELNTYLNLCFNASFLESSISGLIFLLPPAGSAILKAMFKPSSREMSSTTVIIRNNLTGIETLSIRGRAGTGLLMLGSGSPGSSLFFHLTEKILHACLGDKRGKYGGPQFTVRRSFLARNIGEIPLDIRAIEIHANKDAHSNFYKLWPRSLTSYAGGCEGHGFKILNCQPFVINPNQTHSIEIAFTPDFTMTKVLKTLKLTDANGNEFNYSLVAMVPSNLANECSVAISRPSWEPTLKLLLGIGIVIGVLGCACIFYFEAGSIVSTAVVATVRVGSSSNYDTKENTSKLDLKAVYDKVDSRFKRNQRESQQKQSPGLSYSSSSSTLKNESSVTSLNTNVTSMNSNNNNVRNRKSKKSNNQENNLSMSASSSTVKKTKEDVDSSHKTEVQTGFPVPKHTKESREDNAIMKDKEESKISKVAVGKKKKQTKRANKQNIERQNSAGDSECNRASPSSNILRNLPSKGFKMEEETSSTTTESSNPDDLSGSWTTHHYHGKERKLSGRVADCKPSTSGLDEFSSKKCASYANVTRSLEGSTKKKESNSCSPGLMDQEPVFEESRKKLSISCSKKKEEKIHGNLSSVNKGGEERTSNSSQSEMVTRPMPRPGVSAGYASDISLLLGNMKRNSVSPDFYKGLDHMNKIGQSKESNSAGYFGTFQVDNASSGKTNRRPGVIGQPRINTQSSSPLTQHNDVMNAMITSNYGSQNVLSRSSTYGAPSNRTRNSPWSADILPNNGCDIWNRKDNQNSSPNVRGMRNQGSFPSSYFSPACGDFSDLGNVGMFNSTSNSCPAIEGGSPVLHHTTSTAANPTASVLDVINSHPGPQFSGVRTTSSNKSQMTTEKFQGFNASLAEELISNLLQYSSYENQGTYTGTTSTTTPSNAFMSNNNSGISYSPTINSAATASSTSYVNAGGTTTSRSGGSWHEARDLFLRSGTRSQDELTDGGNYFRQRGRNNPSPLDSNNYGLSNMSDCRMWSGNPTQESVSQSQMTPYISSQNSGQAAVSEPMIFPQWGTVGAVGSNYNGMQRKLWTDNSSADNSNATGTNWNMNSSHSDSYQPSDFDQMNPSSNVGEFSRPNMHLSPEAAQSQREVEAGLGFNPFRSDIWDHVDNSWKGC